MRNDTSKERIENSGGNVTKDLKPGSGSDSAGEYGDLVCAAFQAHMAERIASGEDLMEDPHMKSCARCSALMGDLESIVAFAKTLLQAEIEPPETLWQKIESALDSKSDLPNHLSLEGSEA